MKSTLRILHIIPQIGIGGAERQLHSLIVNSDPKVVTHEVLYYSDSNDREGFELYDAAGIKYTRVPRNKMHPVRFVRNLAAEIRLRKPDLVHCWLYSGVIWGRLAAIWASSKAIIVAYRSSHIIRIGFMRMLEMFTSRRVNYLANSHSCANAIATSLGLPVENFHVIYNGIDIEKFNIRVDRNQIFAQLGISEKHSVVTMVGRLTASKNHPMLLRIARKCKNLDLPLHFVVVGHGERETDLRESAREMGVEDTVHFLGLRHDIPEILNVSDIFLFTTLFEGFPNSLLEAMVSGLPVISTDFNGVDELLEDNINGRIVKINDDDAAVSSLVGYLNRPDTAKDFGNRARKTVLENFSMQKMVQATMDLYEEVIYGSKD